ncbi:MAG: signal peptide peptidase SppA [Nanoarchaeota archaeon]
MEGKWMTILTTIAVLGLLSLLFAWLLQSPGLPLSQGGVAIIPVKGVLVSEPSAGFFTSDEADAKTIIAFLREAEDDQGIKAIILDINSPGGSPVPTDEISRVVKESNKTVIAVIHDVGASGAYWIASSADIVVANPMSVVGSIGVVSSYVDFAGLMERYGVRYNRLVSGEYKDAGSPFRNLTTEERYLLQAKLDLIRDRFIDEVAANRNLSREKVEGLADGMVLLGSEAKDAGLVDVLGTRDDALVILEQRFNASLQPIEYVRKESFWSMLSQIISRQGFLIGQGIGTSLVEGQQQQIMV